MILASRYNPLTRRMVALGLAAVMLLPGVMVALLSKHDVRMASAIESGQVDPRKVKFSPLRPGEARQAVRQMLYAAPYDATQTEKLLDELITLQPEDARNRLDRAELSAREGDLKAARQHADEALRLWPTRAPMLWRLASLYSRLGDNDAAMETLRTYVMAAPDEWKQTLAFGLRLNPDIEHVVERLTPRSPRHGGSRDFLVTRMFDWAYSREEYDVARAIWAQHQNILLKDTDLVRSYGWILFGSGTPREMMDLWRDMTNKERPPVTLVNGDFEDRLTGVVSTWETHPIEGVSYKRDTSTRMRGRNSLRVTFDGKHNPDFRHVVQRIPVGGEGGKYIFTGFWRGDGITTRSGVYLRVLWPGAKGDETRGLEPSTGTWPWKRFSFEFTLPAGVDYLDVRLIRYKSKDLDNLLEGRVWLDELDIEKVR